MSVGEDLETPEGGAATGQAPTRPAEDGHRPGPAGRVRRWSYQRNPGGAQVLPAMAFLAPLFVFYGLYFLYAIGFLGKVSGQRVGLSFANAVDVGWENFRLVATDPIFQRSLANTLAYAFFHIAVALTLGFLLAMMLATGVRFRRTFYIVFLMPALIPMALFATVFGQMLETRDGALNSLLRDVGLGALTQDWLGSTVPGYTAVAILLVYAIGLPIMYYTAGATSMDLSVIESAVLDGARTGQIFRLILFPLLKNVHKTVILSMLLGGFRAFDIIYFSTGGKPSGRTEIVGTYIYGSTVSVDKVGFAAAASVIVLLVALVISIIQLVVTRRSGGTYV